MKKINNLFYVMLVLLAFQPWSAFSAAANGNSPTSGVTTYVLQGKVMDTSDN